MPRRDTIVVANAGDGSVHFYDGADFTLSAVLNLGDDADNVRVDPWNDNAIVGYGEGGLAVIDSRTHARLRDIKLPGHPESFQLDPNSNRAYINIPGAGQIDLVDLASGLVLAKWKVPGLAENFPLAIDLSNSTLATVFRAPPRLVILDGVRGAVSGIYPTCSDVDDVLFDPKQNSVHVSCGVGAVDILRRDATSMRQIGRVPTSSGARTSLFVPEWDRLFLAQRASPLGSDSAMPEFQPGPRALREGAQSGIPELVT